MRELYNFNKVSPIKKKWITLSNKLKYKHKTSKEILKNYHEKHLSYNDELIGLNEVFYRENGNAYKLDKHITLFVISDTHGIFNEGRFRYFFEERCADAVICLGDISYDEYVLIDSLAKEYGLPVYSVTGNHDFDVPKGTIIKNINGKIVNVNGVRIAGLNGCYRYRDDDSLYLQKEAIKVLDNTPRADILISHDRTFKPFSTDYAHQGLIAIDKYLYENHVPVHLHGHYHHKNQTELLNGTMQYSCFELQYITL